MPGRAGATEMGKTGSLSSQVRSRQGVEEGVLDPTTGNFYMMPASSKHREAPDRVWGHQRLFLRADFSFRPGSTVLRACQTCRAS